MQIAANMETRYLSVFIKEKQCYVMLVTDQQNSRFLLFFLMALARRELIYSESKLLDWLSLIV